MPEYPIECRVRLTHADFITANHRIHGVPVLPGVTFLDLWYRILSARGADTARAAFRRILFAEPVTTRDGHERELRITIGAAEDGAHPVRVESRWLRDGAECAPWRENARAELVFADAPAPEPLDLPAHRSRAARTDDMAVLYRRTRSEHIVHGPPMTCHGRLHRGTPGLLAELRLDPAALDTEQGFYLHPAKLDASTLVAFGQNEDAGPEGFIPFFIEYFRAPRRLTGDFAVYVPRPEVLSESGELVRNDYALYDEHGAFVAEFRGIACKRIRRPELITGLVAEVDGSATAAADRGDRAGEPSAVAAMADHLRTRIAAMLGRPPAEIPTGTGFYDLGLDSVALLRLAEELESVVGATLYPTLLFEYADIDSLARHLAAEYPIRVPPAASPAPPGQGSPSAPADPPARPEARCLTDVWADAPGPAAGPLPRTLVVLGAPDPLAGALRRRVPELITVPDVPAGDRDRARALLDELAVPPGGDPAYVLVAPPERPGWALWALACALVDGRPTRPVRLAVLTAAEGAGEPGRPELAALGAFAATISAEVPLVRCRVVETLEMDADAAAEALLAELADQAGGPGEPEVRYTRGRRQVRRWTGHVPAEPAPAATGQVARGDAGGAGPYKEGGVYLITGGAGGLARLLAGHLAVSWRANLVLVGRGPCPDELRRRIGEWERHGATVRYLRADVGRAEEVRAVVDQARGLFGRIDGVFHCAGSLADGLFFRAAPGELAELWAAKVDGTVHLDEATRGDDLDFFVLFSSVAGIAPNPGQAAYAYANAFQYHYARTRRGPGRALAIAWPLWAEGGMRVPGDLLRRSQAATGMAPLPTETGLALLRRGLAGPHPAFAVLYGDAARTATVLPAPESAPPAEPAPAPAVSPVPVAAPSPAPIAVIGMAGQYPKAADLGEFWRNLVEGRDCITEVPAERWNHDAYYDPDRHAPGRTYARWGGFLDGVDLFDPAFFGISRRDAERMDPQERLFLTTCRQVLDDAGYPPAALRDETVGVFVGVMWNHYQLYAEDGVAPTAMHASIANRVSYTLDLRGPSMAVDTACSSSLTAVHLAVESIRRGESTMALAGGVNVTVHPQKYLQLAQGQFLSSDGRCRSFGKDGDGYVPGEGVGAVLLKPLDRALADGDHIYGVITATAVNHTGRTGGYTVPSPGAQGELIRAALDRAGWDPATVGYVEAHGTGTSLGDPIEVEGLRQAFAGADLPAGACAIGSVKSNIGHAESAAGIAGLTKVLLQLTHRTLVPSLHSAEPNPHIDFTGFRVQQTLAEWSPPAGGVPLRAGVSAFGAGGANAHVLVEEAPAVDRPPAEPGARLFVFSARTEAALREMARRHLDYLAAQEDAGDPAEAAGWITAVIADLLGVPPTAVDPGETLGDLGFDAAGLRRLADRLRLRRPAAGQPTPDETIADLARRCQAADPHLLADLSYTLQVGRAAMPVRMAVVAEDLAGLRRALEAYAEHRPPPPGAFWDVPSGPALTAEQCAAAFAEGRLAELAAHWVAGGEVDWAACYPADSRPRRRSAPAYPFALERCWIGRWRGSAEAGADRRPAPPPGGLAGDGEVGLRVLDHGIALVTMRDPAGRNMFTESLMRGLQDAFAHISARDDVKAVVVTGTEAVFSLGATPRALETLAAGDSRFTDAPFVYEGMLRCDRPVIAAISGHASGGGLAFGLYADVVVMSRGGVYSANFMRYGFTPGMGATYILQRRFGPALAAEMFFTGREFTGAELERRGADVTFADAGEVLPTALAVARSMAEKPLHALTVLKRDLADRVLGELSEVIARESAMHQAVFGPESAALIRDRFAKAEAFRAAPATASPAAGHAQDAVPAGAVPAANGAPSGGTASPAPETTGSPAPESGHAPSVPDAEAVVDVIEGALCAALYLDRSEIDHTLSFSEMGLDSIGAVELVRELNRVFGLDLDSVAVYDHPTVSALAGHVREAAARDRELLAAALRPAAPAPAGPPAGAAPGETLPAAPPAAAAGPAPGPAVCAAVPSASVSAGPAIGPSAPDRGSPPPAAARQGTITLRPLGDPPGERPMAPPAPPVRLRPLGGSPGPRDGTADPAAADGGASAAHAGTIASERAAAPAVVRGDAASGEQAPVAVIGMAGRFPDAPDLDAFWRNLAAGRDSVREVDRWDVARYFDPDRRAPGRTYSKWAALLDDVDAFDAPFFRISPLEAAAMDPQQRLFLRTAWECLEDAGYAVPGKRRWGVYVGCASGEYLNLLGPAGEHETAHAFLGNSSSMLAARIAYLLDLTGPTLAVDTACSSSLVAVHLACAAIRAGECDAALAGGVALMLTPRMHILTSKAGMLSPTGRSAPFDASADGIVLGEGCGAVLLKRLDRAIADGDVIHGVIAGSGINGDGRTNGITAPSAASQAELIARVLRQAGVAPEEIGYVEAHGTGTPLGDPIEVKALEQVLGTAGGPVGLGSVKSNIGHTTMAAGIAGLLKVLLALRHRTLVPTINYRTPNPEIDFDRGRLRPVTARTPWPPGPRGRRVAAVSSFGFSGTNAHLVVVEPDAARSATGETTPAEEDVEHLIPVSARTPEALAAALDRLADRLADPAARPALADVAHTLAVGRTHFPVRAVAVVRSYDELLPWLREQAEAVRSGRPMPHPADGPAAAYLAGQDVDWAALVRGGRRVSLPGHPFARDRHWVRAAPAGPDEAAAPAVPDLLFAPVWRDAPAVAGDPATGAGPARTVLVAHDPDGLEPARALADAHRAAGDEVQVAGWPDGTTGWPDRITTVPDLVYFLACGPGAPDAAPLALFRAVKALHAAGSARRALTLKAVTVGAACVDGGPIRPDAAGLHGLIRSVAAEHPNWTVGCVDLDPRDGRSAADAARLLLREPCAEPLVAIRNGRRLVRRLRPLPAAGDEGPEVFRRGGVYLIVGGAGGIGTVLARHLARTVGARIALVGRRPRDAAIETRLAELHRLGGQAVYLRADATDPDALREAVTRTVEEYGALHGVFHAALVLRDRTLEHMDEECFTEVLAPKTVGAVALGEALRGRSLDFLVFFSSALSFTESPGQANYAAAGTFEDAWALALRERLPFPVQVVNWGYWGSVGAVAGPRYARRFAELEVESIEPDTGMAALTAVLRRGTPQTVVVKAAPAGLARLGVEGADPIAAARAGFAALERLAPALLRRALTERGVLPGADHRIGREELRDRLAAGPAMDRLADALIETLVDAGHLRRDGETLLVLPETDPLTEDEVRAAHPELTAHLRLLRRCVDALPEVLAGVRPATEVLFPGGSTDWVEAVYRGQASADHCHRLLADQVRAAVASADRPVRILEVGAGTGAGTGFVLPLLDGARAEYHFTDISTAFLRRGEDAFGARYDFVRFGTLDIERDPVEQGYPEGGFDLVLATNVLHAAARVDEALAHARRLLRPGGLLLVNEVTRRFHFLTLTFGLTSGWWRFADPDKRLPHAPLLAPRQWRRALAEAGFGDVRVLGFPDTPPDELEQCVLVATAQAEPAGEGRPAGGPDEEAVRRYVREVFAEVLRFAPADLDDRATFENFGVDSLVSLDIVTRFERDLGPLPSTLLFDHMTIERLAAHLLDAHRERLAALPRFAAPATDGKEPPGSPARPRPSAAAAPASRTRPEDVAVVGVAGRYPGASTPDELWRLLAEGRSGITEVPAERWDWRAYVPDGPGRWGGFLEGVDLFDAGFFGILPRDAENIDPAERLFLETAWVLLEQTGYLGEHTHEPDTGVFVGTMYGSYGQLAATQWAHGRLSGAHSAYWSIANRVSYLLDFTGPSFAVDSACSSSLLAVHLACESIRRGECAMAIAGGVNVILHPAHFASLSALNMLAADGRCKVFDAAADGFVPGEGVGAVLLKPLSRAIADGDRIWGVLKAGAANAGGKTSGYTVPNPNAQAALIADAVRRAGIDPATIGYLEAHGTGTALGDPIEIAALRRALGDAGRCAIGSVKANLGHLEGAAGIAGLTRVLLQLRHGQIAPCVNLGTVNPKIDLSAGRFTLPRTLVPWPRPDGAPRRAGVSSFGAGGANVHLIVEEYDGPAAPPPAVPPGDLVFLLSARTRERLAAYAASVADFLDAEPVPLPELCYTSQVGRRAMPERLAVLAPDLATLAARLRAFAADPDAVADGVFAGTAGPGRVAAGDLDDRSPAERALRWVRGETVEWHRFWPDPAPRRVAFPAYPFERRRYWLDVRPAPEASRAEGTAPAGRAGDADRPDAGDTVCRYHRPVWRPAEAPAATARPRTLLVVGDRDLAERLRGTAEASRVVCVTPGPDCARTGDDDYTLDPAVDDHYLRLAGALDADGLLPDAIVHTPVGDPADLDADVYAYLRLATAVLRQRPGRPLRALFAHTAPDGAAEPRHAAVGAAARTLALEHTRFSGGRVEFAAGPADRAAALLAELAAGPEGDAEVRYADGRRWVRRLEEYPPPDPVTELVRPGGTYLITGGAGALGLRFAGLLAESGAGRVVLAGRSAPSEETARALAALSRGGTEVRYHRADVSRPGDVTALVSAYRPVHGIIHAAGVTRDGLAVRKTRADFRAVWAPKAYGAVLLDEAASAEPLDFFVLFSSVVAETGNPGQADYAAANAFLHAFAERREMRRREGARAGRTLAIGWPLWRDGGMRVDEATRTLFARNWSMVPMRTENGFEAFRRGLAGAETVFCVVESPAAASASPGVPPAAALTAASSGTAGESGPENAPAEPERAVDRVPQERLRERAEAGLRRMASAFLLVDEAEVDLDEDLMDVGFDSISLTELINKVNERYGLELLPTVLFECGTLRAFAEYLAEHHPAALADHAGAAEPGPGQAAGAELAAGAEGGAERPDAAEAVRAPMPAPAADATGEAAGPRDGPAGGSGDGAGGGTGTRPSPAPGRRTAGPAVTAAEPAAAGVAAGGVAIAVIGMAGTLPGADDLDDFFAHLVAGRDLTGPAPADRIELHRDPDTVGVRGGFLADVAGFDAALFRIAPAEAALMDPQQRLFLQTAWRAIEDAGYRPQELAGTDTGLFVGVSTTDYADLLRAAGIPVEAHTASGIAHSILANRVSHVLDLRGPSEAVDTACSSSLVALHHAVRALVAGDCSAALVGGVNVLLSPGLFTAFAKSGMLSPDGACKAFDAAADGYVRGEGVGALLLKPLPAALADGDRVHAVIRGTAVNHGGRAASLTAPNPDAQARVVAQAYRAAGVDPSTVTAIEAHGTGTRLGDPVEIEGLKKAFAELYAEHGLAMPERPHIALGSVKSNIGHLEAAAGIAGMLKMLLALRHGVLPPTIHFTRPGPYLRLAGTPFFINDRARPWTGPGRRAGVSSFGFGGTNAHVVLEEYAGPAPRRTAVPKVAFALRPYWFDSRHERLAGSTTVSDSAGKTSTADVTGRAHAAGRAEPAEATATGPARRPRAKVVLRDPRPGVPHSDPAPPAERSHPAGAASEQTGPGSPLPGDGPSGDRPPSGARPARPGPARADWAGEIRGHVAAVLGLAPDEVPEDRSFTELGLDSIYRIDLTRRLNTAFGLELEAAELYEHDTVAALATHLAAGSAPAPGSAPAVHDVLRALIETVVGRPLDPARGFADDGFTSFDMLRVISVLERRFGALPKTLLFDRPTVAALAAHLVEEHGERTTAELLRAGLDDAAEPVSGGVPLAAAEPAERPAPGPAAPGQAPGGPLIVRKRELAAHPHLAAAIAEIDRLHAKEGGLAGRDIAPLAFLGAGGRAYFNASRRGRDLFAWSYAGSEEDFPTLVGEWLAYAERHGLRASLLSLVPLREAAGIPLLASPFGAVQRLTDLAGFSLAGGRMSRLRYMVRRFERAGSAVTVEYRPGDDPATDREIADMIGRWGEGKQMVNPYVAVVRDELSRGVLADRHRLFLTRLDGALANVVIVTRIPSEPGYLLDLEFYPKDAPLGGLEYAIVTILNRLRDEGCRLFSFGASFGVKICESDNADPEVERGLAELRSAGIFGEGNFQFKNKFRPVNHPIYLVQRADAERTPVADVILMIANPDLAADAPGMLTGEPSADAGGPDRPDAGGPPASSGSAPAGPRRRRQLARCGFNPLNLPHADVEVDLATDSWAELDGPVIARRTRELSLRRAPADFEAPGWLPFDLVVPTGSGRAAEALLCRCWPGPRGRVVHNGLFPTWTFALGEAGFTAAPAGNAGLDPATLRTHLAEGAAFVAVELSANGAGGRPVSLAALRAVREAAAAHDVPLVLDATRIVENAVFVAERERRGAPLWDVVTELLELADAVTMSLSKDFGVRSGGLVATRLPALAERLAEHVALRGRQVDLATRRLLAAALADTDGVAALVRERMAAVRTLWDGLARAGAPVEGPPGGHCVLLDVDRMPWFARLDQPVASALAWLYQTTGVRGAPHLGAGRRIRLAVPLGLGTAEARRLASRFAAAWRDPGTVPDLVPVGDPGAPHARFHPAGELPGDIEQALREGHRPEDDNAAVLREFASDVERRVLRLDGGEVEVFTAGEGPALLLMHPFNIGAGVFGPQFAALAERHRLICVHHPGVGASTAGGGPAPDLTLDGLARLCRAAVDRLGVTGPVHVAGASFGGLVAQAYALRYPGDTASLTLIGSSYKVGNRNGEVNRLSIVAGEDLDRIVAAGFPAAEAARVRELLLRCESMDPHLGLRYLDVFRTQPTLLARLGEIAVPTLVVQGRHDTVIPLKTAHLLHGAIPEARYAELPGAGHFPTLTHPEELHAVLLAFLSGERS